MVVRRRHWRYEQELAPGEGRSQVRADINCTQVEPRGQERCIEVATTRRGETGFM